MAASFSTKEMQDVKKGFGLYDFDGDGKVTTKELGSLLRSLGRTPTNGEVTEMVKEVPADGKIDFDMFLGFLARKGQISGAAEDLLSAFKVFDKEGTGKITVAELQWTLSHLAEPLTKEEAQELAKEMDPQKTGQVDYKEYVKIMLMDAPSAA